MTPLRIFIGYDPRQPVAYNVAQYSILKQSSRPVAIAPLVLDQLPIERTKLTPFTFTRFLVPWLCDYQGWALFMDCDVVVLADIAELFALAEERYDVMVVKNDKIFEWPSVMLFNCAKCRVLTPQYIDEPANKPLDLRTWVAKERIGPLPADWNHLVGYDQPRAGAKLVHFTQGVPLFPEVAGCEYESEWRQVFKEMSHARSWLEIMGGSVHADWQGKAPAPKLQSAESEDMPGAGSRVARVAVPNFDSAYSRETPSPRYRELLTLYCQMHEEGGKYKINRDDPEPTGETTPEKTFPGVSLAPHLGRIKTLIDRFGARRILDYGSGKGQLYADRPIEDQHGRRFANVVELWSVDGVTCYDPAYKPFSRLPDSTFDGVICTDVMEHVPEEDVGWIVDELFRHADKFVFCAIASYPARKHLPTGENCHVTIRPAEWWGAVFQAAARKRPGVEWQLTVDRLRPGDPQRRLETVVVTG